VYPLVNPYIEHDLPLWLELEKEYELYHITPHPIYTLENITIRGKPDEYPLGISFRINLQLPYQLMS